MKISPEQHPYTVSYIEAKCEAREAFRKRQDATGIAASKAAGVSFRSARGVDQEAVQFARRVMNSNTGLNDPIEVIRLTEKAMG